MRALLSLILLTSTLVAGQRPTFAGTRPIGFPDTPNRTTTASLDNRFGEGTTEKLPLEANGDRDLIDRLSKLPVDKQPFWFINWQHLEEQRKNPQTYPQKPNVFVDPIPTDTGISNRFSNDASNTGNSNSAAQFNSGALNSGANRPNVGNTTPNVQTSDRFGSDLPDSNSGGSNSANSNSASFSNSENSNSASFSNSGNVNSGFVKPNLQSASESSGNKNGAQKVTNTQTQAPVIKITDYYPEQTVYRRPGYGR